MNVAAIIPAAGRGARLGARAPKAFVRFFGKPLLVHTLLALKRSYPFREIIVAVDPAQRPRAAKMLASYGLGAAVRLVDGGSSRAASVRRAVEAVSTDCGWALVHDAARPLVSKKLVRKVLDAARERGYGASLCAWPATATVKRSDLSGRRSLATEDRSRLFLAQTPQVFRVDLLKERYRRMGGRALRATDEAALFDGTSVRVRLVPGELRNIKITTPDDVGLWRYYAGGRARARG